jgi:hypothetical protein
MQISSERISDAPLLVERNLPCLPVVFDSDGLLGGLYRCEDARVIFLVASRAELDGLVVRLLLNESDHLIHLALNLLIIHVDVRCALLGRLAQLLLQSVSRKTVGFSLVDSVVPLPFCL